MGADLVAYIAVGPLELDPDKVKQGREFMESFKPIYTALRPVLAQLREAAAGRAEAVPTWPEEEFAIIGPALVELEEKVGDHAVGEAKAFCTINVGGFQFTGLLEILEYCEEMFPDPPDEPTTNLVDEIEDIWNGQAARDMATRTYKDIRIVCAGDTTWGDEPDGRGFQTLKRVFQMGLHRILGIE